MLFRSQRTYEYKVEGNTPQFSDEGGSWSEGVNAITPFSTWELSLPDTQMNKGIVFDGLIAKVTLTFVLKTRIHDARKKMLMMSLAETRSLSSVKPAIGTLISQMAGKSVLNNWDVVFNMSLSKINNVLKTQYDDLKNNDTEYGGRISANTAVQGANIGDILTYTLQKFNLQYGYPKLEFLVNEAGTGNLDMQITQGTVQKGSKYIGSLSDRKLLEALAAAAKQPAGAVKQENIGGEEKLVLQYYNEATPLGSTASLQAVIKIEKMKGLVNQNQNILSVVLDMTKGAFSANKIEIDMSDEQRVAFSRAVKVYFDKHPVMFILNSLDLTGIGTLDDLKPNQFLFKALKTQKGNSMLQLFIQTNERDVFNSSQTYISSDVPDPIPEGCESSLMINSRILFGSILKESMKGSWTFKGNKPAIDSQAWNGAFSEASVNGNVDLSSLDTSYTPPRSFSTSYTSYAPKGGNPVSWDISGMTISPGANGEMLLDYNKKNSFKFIQSSKICSFGCSKPTHAELSTDITLKVTASVPTKIIGSGRDQQIAIEMTKQNVGVDARTSGGGPCGTTDLQAKVNSQLKDSLPSQLTSKVNVSFEGVSVFALKNLLFPSKNYINLQSVYIPGDLLILGNFTTEE